MESLIIFVHVIAAIAITGLVLIQQGKGADMGASFGSGASQTLFGSSGSGNALTKSTSIMAVVFFITSLGLAIIARQQASLSVDDSGLIENLDEIAAAPATQTAAEDLPLAIEDALDDIPELATETAIGGDIPVVDAVPAEEVPE
ncbi:MAG: preprotein translocase subunit SecG [Pseudohongiellaceae bacterium]|jgi:preprotein translocase subunit SecG